jgi:glycine/D-amino acid oxidase-like deaminating enzyme
VPLPHDTSFAIIGAGAAGIWSARTLRDAGYRNVTVVEAEPTAGGKCLAVEVDGKPFDLGCLAGSRADYGKVLEFAASHGTGTVPFRVRHFSLARGGQEPLLTWREQLRLYRELLTCARLHFLDWHGIRPGEMTSLSPELCDSFAEVVERHGLHTVERKIRGMFIACGFGCPADLPAAYAANYGSPRMMMSETGLFTWADGAQLMWQREATALAARGVQFRFDTQVTEICRDGPVQLVTDDGAVITADELIVATDPSQLRLDATAAERKVFSQVRHGDYRVMLCRIEGLPADTGPTMHFIEDNLVCGRAGRPMALFRRHPGLDVFAVYVYGAGLGDEALAANLSRDVAMIGGCLVEHLGTTRWGRYFPHFDAAGLRGGALDDLAALQGNRHTAYVGELANFAILPRIMDNVELTVRRLIGGELPGQRAT